MNIKALANLDISAPLTAAQLDSVFATVDALSIGMNDKEKTEQAFIGAISLLTYHNAIPRVVGTAITTLYVGILQQIEDRLAAMKAKEKAMDALQGTA